MIASTKFLHFVITFLVIFPGTDADAVAEYLWSSGIEQAVVVATYDYFVPYLKIDLPL